ncbi:MAG: bifunctional UDP-N-acetylmuramoyl-tripeptide:D-alanyl-D-alanine ligase/alanine racemase [Cyclobacteriaceae bacterium]|nr:bifunctional UDP-N-acetylmuramoyl-tripeptide:D-alanyl-D-alanine ligase/alanine racemase [Cyclobacteriaceae bacterium]
MYSFSILSQVGVGKVIQLNNLYFDTLSVDSRNVFNPKSTLFFAIKGIQHDGHNYIHELYNKGVRQFVIEKIIDPSLLPEAAIFLCINSIEVLQKLAKHHNDQFDLNTVGITGSNGKTIVKEWLYQLLSPTINIVKSPKSFNSQVGVPLSVWQINQNHELGIFEANISTTHEMEKIAPIIQPIVGIFTNISSVHDEGFSSNKEKINEKLIFFSNVQHLIHCRDHETVHQAIQNQSINGFTWGKHHQSDLQIININKQNRLSIVDLQYKKDKFHISFPFTDDTSIENGMHCVAFLLLHHYSLEDINQRVSELRHLNMRLELKKGINNCQVIEDTYNNDLGAIRVALGFMSQQNDELSKTVIISDVLQSVPNDAILYEQLNHLLMEYNVTKLIGIGDSISKQKDCFNISAQFYTSTEQFLSTTNWKQYNHELILVKGYRPYSFKQIVHQLEEKTHGTILEINLNALTRNLNTYRSKLSNNTKIMVMVKALAYGAGSDEVANLLQHHQVDYFGVAYVDEGVILKQNGIKLPIMVMNPRQESFDKLFAYQLEPAIYNLTLLHQLIDYLKGQAICIHIKIDTGMRRLGFEMSDINKLIQVIKTNQNIKIKSIFTHLAGADESRHDSFSIQQIELFNKVLNKLKTELSISPIVHVLNSVGILRFPEYHFDMVRLGIGLYGVDTNTNSKLELETTNTLKTVVSQIKKIKKGETIGYGRTGIAKSDLRIATIAIGYADGFSRSFSNGIGKVVINGTVAPVIGNVCMDMTMVDITGINVTEGDEVEVFGKQLSITKLAHQINTIPYEILTNVSSRVKRVYYLD